jgi:hypothetical protein
MAKGISKKNLGLGLIIALVIQYVLPMVKLGSLSWIGTLIILVVGLYLLFF